MTEDDSQRADLPAADAAQRTTLTYDWRRHETGCSPSLAVIDALAVATGSDRTHPDELGITLHNHIESDALDCLLTTREPRGLSLDFLIGEYRITIRDDGRIIVQELA